ncbi:hypothetical protein LOD99_12136 [Oopsacas minuta]|uniref:Uncharacterized protein n=1 Tax=Oopsacas minuta TaxID=111878 RepID=A0AAV7JHP2_9METZ|nr:hypothetical protein LOD99_12136 [Oopsacas minuta]
MYSGNAKDPRWCTRFPCSLGHNPLIQCVPSEEEIILIRSNLAAAERAEEEEEGVIPSEVSFRRSVSLVKVSTVVIFQHISGVRCY